MGVCFREECEICLCVMCFLVFLGNVEHKPHFYSIKHFLKCSVSHPSAGTYAARRSQVEVLKEIN